MLPISTAGQMICKTCAEYIPQDKIVLTSLKTFWYDSIFFVFWLPRVILGVRHPYRWIFAQTVVTPHGRHPTRRPITSVITFGNASLDFMIKMDGFLIWVRVRPHSSAYRGPVCRPELKICPTNIIINDLIQPVMIHVTIQEVLQLFTTLIHR